MPVYDDDVQRVLALKGAGRLVRGEEHLWPSADKLQ